MNARTQRQAVSIVCHAFRVAAVALAVTLPSGVAQAQIHTVPELTLERLVVEIRELKRLVNRLKEDEHDARHRRGLIAHYRDQAVRFSNGGPYKFNRNGFVALLQICQQSASQASLLQSPVPRLSANEFVPNRCSFPGGDISDLIEFCRAENVGVRYGGTAQIALAQLAADAVKAAEGQIEELDARIEHYKAQNIAHTDILGKLTLLLAHCHHCHGCYHYGYGYCGIGVPEAPYAPTAGLASKAYDATFQLPLHGEPSSDIAQAVARLTKSVPVDRPSSK